MTTEMVSSLIMLTLPRQLLSKHSEGVLFSPGLTSHTVRIGEFPETKRRER